MNDDKAVRDWIDTFTMCPTKSTAGVRAQYGVAPQGDRTPAYRSITTPVLVIGFAADVVMPPYLGVEVADALPNGRYLEIADAGHLGFLERPHAVNSAILDFFGTGPPWDRRWKDAQLVVHLGVPASHRRRDYDPVSRLGLAERRGPNGLLVDFEVRPPRRCTLGLTAARLAWDVHRIRGAAVGVSRSTCSCRFERRTGAGGGDGRRGFVTVGVLRRRGFRCSSLWVVCAGGFTVWRLHGIFGTDNRIAYSDTETEKRQPYKPKQLVYEVFGPPGTVADISYFDVDSEPRYIEKASLPWSLKFPMTGRRPRRTSSRKETVTASAAASSWTTWSKRREPETA